jgi:amino acid adenylation domain-containing protein
VTLTDRLAALTPKQRALLEQLRQERRAERAGHPPAAIPRVSGPGGAGDWPLSFDQERLWFLSLLDPQGTAYNMTTATRLLGDLDVPALAWAFGEVLRRQGAWRATFPAVEGSPVQRIAPEVLLPLPVVDLAALPGAVRAPAVLDLAAAAARRPFTLDRGPLLRASLIRLGEREHVCLLAVHHIASDWVTLQLFWSELAALYPARLAGRPAALPELPIQYPDFVLWQRDRLQGEVLDRQLAGWTERLRGFPLVLDLPADRPRPATESMRGGRLTVRVGPETTGRLRELSRRENATRFMIVTALCAVLFHRLSGQEKLILGTLNANRNRPELQPLFGFLLTQLPLAIDLTGDPPLRELLARVRGVAVEAYAHPDLPFGKLVEALQPERELGRMPVVQTLVQLLESHAGASGQSLGDLRLEPLDLHDGNARYDLMFSLFEEAGSIHGPFEYNAEIFDATTAARMLDVFLAMTEAAAGDPSLRVSGLPAFSEAARQQVLLEWNDTAAEEPVPTVVELFEAQAARTPEAVAWTGDGWILTYAELDERSGRLARHLHRLGVGPEDLVGIYLERTRELPVALLGVLRSGAAYLPLDAAHPAERRAFLLEDAGAALVLTQERLLSELPAGVRAVCLDSGWEEIAAAPAALPRVRIEPESRAYVIYTSGSTGTPKGVEIPHRALANFVRAMRRLYTVEAGDAMPAITTIAFDLSVPELYLPMLGGGTTPLLGRDTAADGALLARALDACGATVLQATPATYRMLLESGWPGRPELLLLCGAEPLHRDLADRLLPLGRGLWNFYGPTETTVWSTAGQVEEGGPISLGRPIAETRVHLLDQRLAPVPLGAIGEICIGGAGLARGYLRRPALTAERFVPDPFSTRPGERLYRTGDLGRFRPDGRLDHLGRADHQVKLRGFRIEPGEIEAALRNHPAVAEAVVLLREDRPGDPRLVAWLEIAPGAAAPAAAELREHLRRRLPDYMVPAAFVPLPSLPRNANGKLDRRALPAPEGLAARPGAEPVAPRDEVEAEVAAIWRRLLAVDRIGVHDDFFELGGHSLLANRVLAAVRERLGAEVPLRALFQAPTVAGLAAAARQARASREGSGGLPPIERQPRRGGQAERFPVSFSQLREWILDRLEPGTPAYNVPAPVRVAGPLAVPLLAASLGELVRRHESLRTTFEAEPEEPLQVVAPHLDLPVGVVDLEGLPGPAREAELRRLLAEDLGLGFDLARGPLLRARVLRFGAEDHAVLFTVHHIVSDGWSIGIFLRELGEVYEAFSHGRPSPLPELAVQYPDYAVWQRQRLRGEVLDGQVRWWREQLASAPPLLELPTDRPRPPVRSSRGGELPVLLPSSLVALLRTFAARQGTSLFVALLAAFQALLARLSGQEDVCTGTFASNRPRTELEGLIGFFVNTLVLRTDLSGDPSLRELTARVHEVALGVYAHQELPFEKLLEALDVPRDPSRTPLFQVMLVLQSFPRQRIELSRIALTPLEFESRRANFDLTLWLAERPDGLGGFVDYSTDLFEPATVARVMNHLRTLLQAAVADPDRRLWSLPLLAPEERAEILGGWSRTVEEPPGPPLLHRLVEVWAERTPQATAVETADGERLTYAELDARARRLARHLRQLGVGPEARVGLAAERSAEMLVGMLAVLKAGGAYVPLDPAYPRDRLDFMLEDSAAVVLLTQERLASRIPVGGARVVLLDAAPFPDQGGEGAEVAVDPGNPAYVIYTSGSTGRPKGVVVPHRSIAAYVRTAREYYAIGPADRVLQLGSISFDTSAEEIYPALAAGATVVLRPADRVASMRHFLRELDRLGITLLALQTAFWHEIVAGLIEGLDLPASLRLVAFGGEAALADRVEAWRRRIGPGVRLVNTYGPTEATIVSTYRELAEPEEDPEVPIGRPVPGARVYVVDRRFEPAPPGVAGELMIGGAGLARGYLGRPDLTAERFVPDPFSGEPGARLYRTGDLARFRAGGDLLFAGRADRQLKLRGYRIEPGEIEAALRLHPALRDAVADLRGKGEGARLVAWVVAREGVEAPGAAELRAFLHDRLPEAMVPSLFVPVPALPLTPSGKLDRRALPEPEGLRLDSATPYAAPASDFERTVAGIFAELLRVDRVGRDDNFFDLGGHSLLVVRAHQRLCRALGREIPVVDLFRFPTVALLARHLGQAGEEDDPTPRRVQILAGRRRAVRADRIAIVGMAGRFPGARSVEELWARLRGGADCIRDLTDEDLQESGVDPAALPPGYVRRAAVVEDVELFDAAFFGYSPEEAEILDPQLRLFLECAWEALESAAWVPDEDRPEQVGVFAGTGLPAYLMSNLLPHPRIQGEVDPLQLLLANDRDFFATRVAYTLDLRGPALGVQSASSTSLAAVHLACQSLLAGQCTLALAGGVRITVPQKAGYVARDGLFPPDGRCRAFDAEGRGAPSGSGVGVVVLKRLEDALADGDPIHAVIRGFACNNDGALKAGYAVPSVDGQAEVIALAQAMAEVEPETIGYVEAHGSGTPLGDAIEAAALTRAFRARTRARGFCALGSIKTNVGHLESAAGIAGLIKAVLAVERGEIPPSLHFETPNPEIDFAGSPFYVNTRLREWPRRDAPRRAGVSSFGMGGTNVHMVLEEAPEREPTGPARPWQLLVLSARTASALERRTDDLADWLEAHPDADLADVAHTLQIGRRAFSHRRALVCRDREEAVAALRSRDRSRLLDNVQETVRRPVALLFPGCAGHSAGVALGLYRSEPTFRAGVDRAAALLREVGIDLLAALRPQGTADAPACAEVAPLAAFAVQHALAKLLIEWGIHPSALAGSGLGEHAAACFAGVLSFDDALLLLARLAGGQPGDARDVLQGVRLSPPAIPCFSHLTGSWVTAEQATDPGFWVRPRAEPERFDLSLAELLRDPAPVLVEIGPGESLASLARQLALLASDPPVGVPILRPPQDPQADCAFLLGALARLWLAGLPIDWAGFATHERRRSLHLPTHPFERKRCWIDRPGQGGLPLRGADVGGARNPAG